MVCYTTQSKELWGQRSTYWTRIYIMLASKNCHQLWSRTRPQPSLLEVRTHSPLCKASVMSSQSLRHCGMVHRRGHSPSSPNQPSPIQPTNTTTPPSAHFHCPPPSPNSAPAFKSGYLHHLTQIRNTSLALSGDYFSNGQYSATPY